MAIRATAYTIRTALLSSLISPPPSLALMAQSSSTPPTQYHDESPINLTGVFRWLPRWLRRYIPIGGNHQADEAGKSLFGMTVFLLSESMVFVGFFLSYILLRTTVAEVWVPAGIQGPSPSPSVIFHTVVLASSSFVIYFAERALSRGQLNQFRLLWLLTSAMGIYFLIGEAVEWAGLDFGLDTGLMGGTFYILTGFHGLHVATGIVLQMVMLGRSFLPDNYNNGHIGVSEVSLFWHFVDVIWLVLFALVYLW